MTEPAAQPTSPDPASAGPESAEGTVPTSAAEPRRRRRPTVGGGWLLVLALLATAVVADRLSGGSLLPPPESTGAAGAVVALRGVSAGDQVLVAMDADLGTYPEIRPAVRAALADLAGRGATLGFLSVSVEGRAIAIEELERLRASDAPSRMIDFGFVSGAEAALVRLTDEGVLHGATTDSPSGTTAAIPGGISSFQLVLVVGGSDIGPRTWVEQVGTRLPELPMVAIAPTFARPELEPYLRTGQLTALLATVGDDAAFVRAMAGDAPASDRPPGGAALLAGMLVALLVIGQRLLAAVPRLAMRPGSSPEAEES